MKLRGAIFLLLLVGPATSEQEEQPLPIQLLGSIGNVAASATNLLTGFVQRQNDLVLRLTNTASEYINSAVEKPRSLLIDATRLTTDYIDSAATKGLEFDLGIFLEKFRKRMQYGLEDLGIPQLEPLEIEQIDLQIDNPEIGQVSLQLKDLLVRNLSTFIVDRAKLSLIGPSITANITVPELYVEGLYNISGNIGGMLNVFGSGPFTARFYDFKLYVNSMLGFSRGLYLKTFVLDFWVKSMSIYLENFMGDEELSQVMNKILQQLSPKVLDIIKPDILPVVESYVGSRVNETIQHLTMRDVISILVGPHQIRNIPLLIGP